MQRKNQLLTGNSQLSHQIRRHIKKWIRTSDLFLLVAESSADWMPFGVALVPEDVLVAIAFEIDHVAVLLQLI